MPTITAPNTWRLAQRFVWKEYRMLRELALGVIGLALVAMLFVHAVGGAESVRASAVMLVAIGAAAMTAIAAAVTLFSVETEEGTAELLRILPAQRRAQFLGKVSAGVGTVLAVLAILVAIALALAGPPPNAGAYASQGAMVLAEAFVWALLASLLCPNPLVAAVLGIAGASLNSQLAMALTTASTMGYTLQSYEAAIPARLVLIAMVGALDVWLGLHWPRPIAVAKSAARTKNITAVQPTSRRWRTEFWRFVWQTVRQSWKTAAVVLVLGAAITLAFLTVTGYWVRFSDRQPFISFLGLLFTPALLGAAVFREDQRQRQYRFLSERIGRPRTLWLARQTIGLALIALGCLIGTIVLWVLMNVANYESLSGYNRLWDFYKVVSHNTIESLQLDQSLTLRLVLELVSLLWSAAFAAYAVGQLCSLTLRSNVLAGMLALVSSVFLSAWGMVIFAWRLPAHWFMAPIGLAALFASLVYIKDWLFERGRLRTWVTHVVIVLAPFVVLPTFRTLWRENQLARSFEAEFTRESGRTLTERAANIKLRRSQGADVADAYTQLAGVANESSANQPFPDEAVAEFIRLSKIECDLPLRLDPRFNSPDLLQPLQQAVLDRYPVSPADTIPEAEDETYGLEASEPIVYEPSGRQLSLEDQLDRLLACRRMSIQVSRAMAGEFQTFGHYSASAELLAWATHPNQTTELLLKAVRELTKIDELRPKPSDTVVASYLDALAVVRGEREPHFLQQKDYQPMITDWLAYFAHQLPGEQQRAERAAEIMTTVALDYALQTEALLTRSAENDVHALLKRERLTDWNYTLTPTVMLARATTNLAHELVPRALQVEDAATSYLVANEFRSTNYLPQYLREWFDKQSRGRAERVRLALLAYRLKHGAYPESLDELTPDFMQPEEYQDPYGTGPFGYARNGFPHKLFLIEPILLESGAPGTPVIWSIGSGAAKPTVRWLVREENDNGTMDETIVERDSEYAVGKQREEVMTLDSSFTNAGAFWLPLPK